MLLCLYVSPLLAVFNYIPSLLHCYCFPNPCEAMSAEDRYVCSLDTDLVQIAKMQIYLSSLLLFLNHFTVEVQVHVPFIYLVNVLLITG